jgi:hypothetical protein
MDGSTLIATGVVTVTCSGGVYSASWNVTDSDVSSGYITTWEASAVYVLGDDCPRASITMGFLLNAFPDTDVAIFQLVAA